MANNKKAMHNAAKRINVTIQKLTTHVNTILRDHKKVGNMGLVGKAAHAISSTKFVGGRKTRKHKHKRRERT